MIAWNGLEEILLLSTDMRASETARVLEVLPLPSEPKAKKGGVEALRRAAALINRKIRKPFAFLIRIWVGSMTINHESGMTRKLKSVIAAAGRRLA
jgi:hypothetical protein